MKTLFKKAVVVLAIIFIGTSSFAVSDDATYSGYYVSKIIHNTTKLFLEKNLLSDLALDDWRIHESDAENQQAGGMLPVFPFIKFEQDFMNYCIGKKLITKAQATIALDKSKHCGGLLINEYNLLVLHAALLGSLVDNKHLTLKEAQDLLDSSRKEK